MMKSTWIVIWAFVATAYGVGITVYFLNKQPVNNDGLYKLYESELQALRSENDSLKQAAVVPVPIPQKNDSLLLTKILYEVRKKQAALRVDTISNDSIIRYYANLPR